jgi:hypothetical protein
MFVDRHGTALKHSIFRVYATPTSFSMRSRWLALAALLAAALTAAVLLSGLGSGLLHGSGSAGLGHSLPRRPDYIRHTGNTEAQSKTLTVEPAHVEKEFAPGAVGLSIEADELATPDLSANHKSLVELMRPLGPGVLRVGGNAIDYSWWTSRDEQPPAWATSVVTPADLASLRRLLIATDWRAILGIDLGHFDPDRAANEAYIATHILGSSLLGFEIGNEPNDYGGPLVKLRSQSYTASDYIDELATYSTAMKAVAPGIRIYGPDLSSHASPQAWLQPIASDHNMPFAAITQHYYPTSYSVSKAACKGTPVPTALELLSSQVRERENTFLQALTQAGQISHRETRITETNTTASCDTGGGPATSPVFASALWALDWTLRSVSAGVAGLNFHGYFGRCAPDGVNPICAPGYMAEEHGRVIARPEYYGLLAARQLEGGRFLPVNLDGQSGLGGLTAYATLHPDHVITLAIDDLDAPGTTHIYIRIPGYTQASEERLLAPAINARGGVTFGGATFTDSDQLRPARARVAGVGGNFPVTIPPASALILWLRR